MKYCNHGLVYNVATIKRILIIEWCCCFDCSVMYSRIDIFESQTWLRKMTLDYQHIHIFPSLLFEFFCCHKQQRSSWMILYINAIYLYVYILFSHFLFHIHRLFVIYMFTVCFINISLATLANFILPDNWLIMILKKMQILIC